MHLFQPNRRGGSLGGVKAKNQALFGKAPDFQEDGACYNNPVAYEELYPPRIVGGKPLSLAEYDDIQVRGLAIWCSGCPIMMECGREAAAQGLTGPFGGRIFWEGKEVGLSPENAKLVPGPAQRLYTENLTNSERSDRNHCHGLLGHAAPAGCLSVIVCSVISFAAGLSVRNGAAGFKSSPLES